MATNACTSAAKNTGATNAEKITYENQSLAEIKTTIVSDIRDAIEKEFESMKTNNREDFETMQVTMGMQLCEFDRLLYDMIGFASVYRSKTRYTLKTLNLSYDEKEQNLKIEFALEKESKSE